MAEDLRLFGITGDSNAALDPGAWYCTVRKEGYKSMVTKEMKASEHRQRKREAEYADKVEVAPGLTVASLRRFRVALIGQTRGLSKRRQPCL